MLDVILLTEAQRETVDGTSVVPGTAADAANVAARMLARNAAFAVSFSFAVNIVLLALKLVAVVTSGALVLWTSLVDSVLDLLSNSIIFFTARAQRTFDPHGFPVGRAPLEAVGIVAFAAVTGMGSVQLIRESATAIADGVSGKEPSVTFSPLLLGVLLAAVVLKMLAWIVCFRARTAGPAVRALLQDHRNDIATNAISILATYIAADVSGAWWVDPAAALVFSLYLLVGWIITGKEQVQMLSGRAAGPETMAALTWVAMTASAEVRAVDTVRAYHVGTGVQAEVDVVLPRDMPLHQAHDIAEALTLELEGVPEVDRAFVHLDYETEHSAMVEHRYSTRYRERVGAPSILLGRSSPSRLATASVEIESQSQSSTLNDADDGAGGELEVLVPHSPKSTLSEV